MDDGVDEQLLMFQGPPTRSPTFINSYTNPEVVEFANKMWAKR